MRSVAAILALGGLPSALSKGAHGSAGVEVQWTQTARKSDGSLVLLEDMPPLHMGAVSEVSGAKIAIDSSLTYQEHLGFGGAFTEAAAINWRKLTPEDQEAIINLYFADPAEGGLGYTMGRVPINSCDFSPASYTFDDVAGDVSLQHFDDSVQHDVDAGIIPMILAAQKAVARRGLKLRLLASPWSPPAWMKLPVEGVRSQTLSAKPTGLDPEMQKPWAAYISRWISAYEKHGIDVWAVTVQNEPEAAPGWEAMLWTPEFMASFVKSHLGPTLKADHPAVRIVGFDHNKDHVDVWAQGLYADEEAKAFFSGVGVHWYGGLNTDKLQATHELAPDKFILGTEACNCVGNVVYSSPNLASWWTRAERLALDILEDYRFWAVGWIDWNLLVSPEGGPNHLKNNCDANIIADPDRTLGGERAYVQQASFYYMGHLSRFLLPGAKRVELQQDLETEIPPLTAADVKNGNALSFVPCEEGAEVQQWQLGKDGTIVAKGTDQAPGSDGYGVGGECVEHCISGECWFPKVQVWACAQPDSADPLHGSVGNQKWDVRVVAGGHQLLNPRTKQCLTAVKTAGWAVGLDAGLTVTAAQLAPCYPAGTRNQTFLLAGDGDGDGLRDGAFTVSTVTASPLCLQPQLDQLPKFSAVAFEQPDGSISLTAMNTNDYDLPFTLVHGHGSFSHSLPGHAIHSYRWSPPSDGAAAFATLPATSVASAAGTPPKAHAAAVALVATVGLVGLVALLALHARARDAARRGAEAIAAAEGADYVAFAEREGLVLGDAMDHADSASATGASPFER